MSLQLAVIGDPVAHSLSPVFQNAMLCELGLQPVYTRIHVPAGGVAGWLTTPEAQNLTGFNVTMPHKTDLLPLMATLSPRAQHIGAVNTVAARAEGLYGTNTDGIGFVRSLVDEGVHPAGLSCVVLGAGGAARAVVCGLLEAGARRVVVCCRTPSGAHMPPDVELLGWDVLDDVAAQADVLINATPMGMHGVVTACTNIACVAALPRTAVVCDLIYCPQETALLQAARQRGHLGVNGLGMLVHQGIAALEVFMDATLDVTQMRRVAMKALDGVV